MSAVAETQGPRLWSGPFFLICAVVGPAMGFVTMLVIGDLRSPAWMRTFSRSIVEPQLWAFAYLMGWMFAVPAAMIFIAIEVTFRRSGLGFAVLAAVIPPLLISAFYVVGYAVTGRKMITLNGALDITLVCVVAMVTCWLLARVLGIIR